MSTESQDNAESGAVDSAARLVYRILADAVESIGGMDVAAGICGMDRSDLRKALDRNGRRVGVEHALAIGARLARYNPSLATKLASAFAFPLGLEVFPRVVLTEAEENRRMKAWFARMPMGEQQLAEALK